MISESGGVMMSPQVVRKRERGAAGQKRDRRKVIKSQKLGENAVPECVGVCLRRGEHR